MLPHTPCRQFYISHLHNQPWVQVRPAACTGAASCGQAGCMHSSCRAAAAACRQSNRARPVPSTRPLVHPSTVSMHDLDLTCPPQGNYSDLMVKLSAIFSQLRGDRLAEAQGGSAQVGALPWEHAQRLGVSSSCTVLGARVALLLQLRQHAMGNPPGRSSSAAPITSSLPPIPTCAACRRPSSAPPPSTGCAPATCPP